MLLDKKIPLSYLWKKVYLDLVVVLTISVLMYMYSVYFNKLIPPVPIALPAFLGTAITLLLSFKLNQSYDRWWEARKIWGAIVNDSRTWVIQLKNFVQPGHETLLRTLTFRQIAWCYCLGQSLRGLNPVKDLDSLLSASDLEKIYAHSNKPLAILDLNAKDLSQLQKDGKLEIFHHVQLDQTLVRLCDSMGKAERINNTVFPTTYRLFLHLFLYIFIIILSLSLADLEGIYEIPLLLVIAIPFFLLEKTAYHLQDPFRNRPTDTAVTTIAQNIEINLKQLLNEKDIPKQQTPESFYIL